MNDALHSSATAETRLRQVLDRTTAAALAVSGAAAGRVFEDLAESLATILCADAALIGEFADERRTRMRTLAVWLDGRHLRNFEYDVTQTPCRHIVGRASRFVSAGVHHEFAPGSMFESKGFDAYAGYSLFDADERQVGLIVALNRRPLADSGLTEALMKIFAVRAAAEVERRRAAAALQDSEVSYRALFEAAQDAIFVHDWDSGAIVDVNPRACDVYGYSREDLLGASIAELSSNVPPCTAQDAARHMEDARRGQPVRIEWQRRNRDGSLHWDEVVLQPATIGGVPRILALTREITERKEAEAALRASEEQYRAIFNASADALVLWDSSLRRVDVNPAYERTYGWKRGDMIGRGYEHLDFPPDYFRPRLELIRRALAGENCRAELEAIRKDGERIQTEVHAVPFRHRGEPHVLAIARDITERKRAEQALRDSEGLYRELFNASADAMVLRDADFHVVDVNPSYTTMSGYSREETLGAGRVLTIDEVGNVRWREAHQRMLAGEHLRFEFAARRKDGTPYEAEVRGMPVRYHDRPHVLYVSRDITERKRAERALAASEEQYRAIFNASADAMVMRDDQMRVVDVNPAFLSLLGRTREEVVGHVHPAFVIAPEREAAEDLLRRALAGRGGRLEVQSVSADGVRREIDVRAMPMQYQGRSHVLAIARDMTAERRGERESRRLEAQLRQAQKMEAIGQLTGGVAHDFNNILASVMGYTVLAEERAVEAGDGKAVDYLGQALASCRRARDLIQQMLTFSRGGRGEARVVDLAALVRDALPMLRASLPSTLQLLQEYEPETPTVRIDEVQAHQVLLNLAINARDAMSGVGELHISVRRREADGSTCASCRHALAGTFVELSVGDRGGGIAPELLDRIFDPFFTTKAPGKGSGMGLSMVHGIVHEYGGHVIVDNAPGHGAVFRVLWPACTAAADSVPSAAPRLSRRPLAGRVLLVDDEPAVLGSMRELLSGWGLQVAAFELPEQALAAFEAGPQEFDLAITDLAMPQLSGIELVARLRSQRELPVLLSSGFVDDAALAAAREVGVHAVLRKPLEPAELRAAVEAVLPAPTDDGGHG